MGVSGQNALDPGCWFPFLGHGLHPLLLPEAVAVVRGIEAVRFAASPGDADRDHEGAVGVRCINPHAEPLHGGADVDEVSDLRSLVAEAFTQDLNDGGGVGVARRVFVVSGQGAECDGGHVTLRRKRARCCIP